MLTPDLIDALPACPEARYGGSRAFLFEISRFTEAAFVPQFAQLAVLEGWKPVFAHPERYPSLDERNMHAVLDPLAQLGIPMQLTAASLTGLFGPRPQNLGRLIARTYPDCIVISSDAHENQVRIPGLSAGYAELDRIHAGLAVQARQRLSSYLKNATL
jgi:tyrosine-protein phosphatase YwqE